MKIKFENKTKVFFGDLQIGDVFLYGGAYYMKCLPPLNCNNNVINLKETYMVTLDKDVLVTPVEGYFKVYYQNEN